ncbi:MAG: zinc-ribbon domain-containing protein [Candidatus Thorarchaeota archaeon]|nr:zinc-ribbon domain-containing protein [Candidatus Thorarchaeota archaeon]
MAITRYNDDYDDRAGERPVKLDRTEGFVVIEGRAYPARELVEALAQSGYAELRAEGDTLVLGRRRITPVYKSVQERAMAALCHGSLAYCCPLGKRCVERDRALEMLGLTPTDYERMKSDSHHRFLGHSRGIEEAPDQWTYGRGRGRIASGSATDPGFGTEDYRRDFDSLDYAVRARSTTRDCDNAGSRDVTRNRDGFRRGVGAYERPVPESGPDGTAHGSRRGLDSDVSKTTCQLSSREPHEGLGALFMQGELSPFVDDTRQDKRSTVFCFSCGKTIEAGVSKCPYCGTPQ